MEDFLYGPDDEFLAGLREALINRATANPLFVLQVKDRHYGIDPSFHDPDGWTLTDGDGDLATATSDPGGEIPEGWSWTKDPIDSESSWILLDATGEEVAENDHSRLPIGWEWRPFRHEWVDFQGIVSFSEKGIEDHLRLNRHNYNAYDGVRTWVASMFRCEEMQRLRKIVMSGRLVLAPTLIGLQGIAAGSVARDPRPSEEIVREDRELWFDPERSEAASHVTILLGSAEDDAELTRIAAEAGVSRELTAQRLVIAGLKMFSGMASDQGFELAMDVEVEKRPSALFIEDGSGHRCGSCGGSAEIVIDKNGVQPGTPSEPESHWGSGFLKCDTCGTRQEYEASS